MGVERFHKKEDRYLCGPPVDLPCYLTFVISNSLPLIGMYRLCFLFKGLGGIQFVWASCFDGK